MGGFLCTWNHWRWGNKLVLQVNNDLCTVLLNVIIMNIKKKNKKNTFK